MKTYDDLHDEPFTPPTVDVTYPPAEDEGWVQPNVTAMEAAAMGLHIAELQVGGEFVRAYGRTRDEAIANAWQALAEAASLHVTGGES